MPPCVAGAAPCAGVPPHPQPGQAGHTADGRGAGAHRPADRPHPAPPQRGVRPREGRLREEDQRVSSPARSHLMMAVSIGT